MIAFLFALLVAAAPPSAAARGVASDGAARDTLSRVVPVAGVEVSTARPGDRAPVSRSVVDRATIGGLNWGQDTPMALAALPGAYAYSDAGNGIGYSYLSIRGFPQRRISVLLDGVPLNDPESHEVYWIDHPDLLASTAEVQLQRGVGSALYGAAALGGSVNLDLAPLSDAPHSAVDLAYGTWNTKRLMFETTSGPLANGWNLYGRYSRVETDGYRDQSWSNLWSYALSARRAFGNQTFRATFFGGPEETHLAYLGVPAAYMEGLVTGNADVDRKFNPLTYDGERDHFFEPHYELVHSWGISPRVALTQTLFWFDGTGYYDEQRFGHNLTDYRLAPWQTSDSTLFPRDYYAQDGAGNLVRDSLGRVTVTKFDPVRRRSIVDHHYGWVPRLRWAHAGGALTLGAEARWHDGHHTGEVLSGNGLPPGTPVDWSYYDFHPHTFAGGVFAREEWNAAPAVLVTADLAWRHEDYSMQGDRFDGIHFDQPYDFGLPRVGVTWTPRSSVTMFGSWAYAGREPSFQDLYDGEGGGTPLFRHVDAAGNGYSDPLIGPEHVSDFELGGAWSGHGSAARLDLFRMDFDGELIPYEYNADVNNWVTTNAARSVHQGVEAEATTAWRLPSEARMTLGANATLSDNHFVRFTDALDAVTSVSRDGRTIPFFPSLLLNGSGGITWRGASLGADAQYVGRIYVDNSQSIENSVGPHTVVNLRAAYQAAVGGAHATVALRMFNALDDRYATTGYMDYDALGNLVPFFTPAATRNVLGEVKLAF